MMRLAQFITASSKRIVSEWEEFARVDLRSAITMDLTQRRDHVEGMLRTIALDLDTPQTKREQRVKSKGRVDAAVGSDTPANAHGTDRAATGFSPVDLVAEFRALRASILRMWSETQIQFDREHLDDVTRFNEAIDQLLVESLTTFAEDVERSKDTYLGILGHDLRNPLGAILMSATALMTQGGPDGPYAKAASRIFDAGTRMDGLISDLVDFTRTRLGSGIPIVRTDVDLEAICRQAIDEIRAFHPGCVVHVDATGDLHGSWDGGRIGQVLSNLVGNAFQHGAQGCPIDVALHGEAADVLLTVHNTGPLIPASQLREIFNPFQQLGAGESAPKDARSIGLGLFIVHSIVIAHHGTIDVASTKDGTTFTVRLPRSVSNATRSGTPAA